MASSSVSLQPRRVELGLWTLLKIAGIIFAAGGAYYGGYYTQNQRIRSLEQVTQWQSARLESFDSTMLKLNSTLDRLNYTLQDFPLHRHQRDGEIIYPAGTAAKAWDGDQLKRKE